MRRAAVVVALTIAAAGCSPGDDETSDGPRRTTTMTRTPKITPARLEGPITAGELSGPADPKGVDLDAIGYVQEEFFASGDATRFVGDEEPPTDGRWSARPAGTAPYRTRFVVRRPASPGRFNGTVVVEWLNVSAVEVAAEWAYTGPAIVDAGAAWVGVSAQALGVVGGRPLLQVDDAAPAEASGGIRASNPERYGSLAHPGDAYAMDIYSQVGAALRSPGDVAVLGDETRARLVIAAGESQSAGFLTGYVNAIQSIADVYDGFFVHSRGSGAARLDGASAQRGSPTAYRFRTDLDAPALVFQTETDVGPLLKYGLARQPDTDTLRVWEVAGTAHADSYIVGGEFSPCPLAINSGPQHWVAKAAMGALLHWVVEGVAPPRATPIETTGDGTTIVRDEHGNALGGIRTPSVDVPVATLTGEALPDAPLLCALFGRTVPFDAAKLRSLCPTTQHFLGAFDAALDDATERGFVRRADRAAYAAEARAVELPG